ncbi:MAG TPA: hypothetical protein VLQ45_08130, partial [Thermoanaerobaculia bacterium]|nr:hypothetical protein [Thermoanaerobaculia bacterium]
PNYFLPNAFPIYTRRASLKKILWGLVLLGYGSGFFLHSKDNHALRPMHLFKPREKLRSNTEGNRELLIYPLTEQQAVLAELEEGTLVKPCFVPKANRDIEQPKPECLNPVSIAVAHAENSGKGDAWIALSFKQDQAEQLGRFIATETRYLLVLGTSPSDKALKEGKAADTSDERSRNARPD